MLLIKDFTELGLVCLGVVNYYKQRVVESYIIPRGYV